MTSGGHVREPYKEVMKWIEQTDPNLIHQKHRQAEALFRQIGITFAVYGEGGDSERLIPFDIMPRVFTATEWEKLERGVKQRARALNAFLWDVYHRGEIILSGRMPGKLVYQNDAYEPSVVGFSPSQKVFSHIIGVDLVRTGADEFYVLEDNCRTPSGVSYMLENREIMMRLFPQLFRTNRIMPVDNYPGLLRKTLKSVAPEKCDNEPTVVVLTPGAANSAYFEHSFLADQMGVELVEGRDLFIKGDFVFMRTTRGPRRVDVIYRRIDDAFIDPLCFRADSLLGVPGLMNAYRAGGVQICSAPGAGVADDKAVYTYVPEMIRFYLGEEPILNNVQTWRCSEADDLKYVLDNLADLVVKEVHGSGGYGMLVGPASTKAEIEQYRLRILADPEDFIAQPTLALSTTPTYVEQELAPRHVDLRPYCLVGESIELCPGGLTRVAMREGSLVVNSSQGGGVKDTWVLSN
ncbi:circularly permuted type 2 ATP-grasp protein [Arenicella xantha]|uniref:Putative circularly permuted ATP-grasp superfamily protein n=1 Tax=Arenicella xantha TaxID=644221 RepID=A0A395JLY7_9GAMM|nr:putative circularly permuted ATP-grasp superfamily protein [Arenicella xantha]